MIVLHNIEILGGSPAQDIVVQSSTVTATTADAAVQEGVISFDHALAFPGLINSHDHLEFDNYEQFEGGPYRDYVEWAAQVRRRYASRIAELEKVPRQARVRSGIARNLLSGVTSVAHHGSPVECVDAPIEVIAGTRSVHSPRLEDIRGLIIPVAFR